MTVKSVDLKEGIGSLLAVNRDKEVGEEPGDLWEVQPIKIEESRIEDLLRLS